VRKSEVQVFSPAGTFLEGGGGAGVEPGRSIPRNEQDTVLQCDRRKAGDSERISVRKSELQVFSPARTFFEGGGCAGFEPGRSIPSSAQEQFAKDVGGRPATGIMSRSTGESKARSLARDDPERRDRATYRKLGWRWLRPTTGALSEGTQLLCKKGTGVRSGSNVTWPRVRDWC
jgi:hypothetical protein